MEREVSCNPKGTAEVVREVQESLCWWYLLMIIPSPACASFQAWLAPGWNGLGSRSWISVLASVVTHGQEVLELPCSDSSSTFWIFAVTEDPLESS